MQKRHGHSGQKALVESLVSDHKATRSQDGAYAPRDVVNAPALKASIARRSTKRCDSLEVAAWLANHFYRHVVGNLDAPAPQLRALESMEQARAALAPTAVPSWVSARLSKANSATLWWIDPEAPALLEMEGRLVEFLNARQGTSLQGKLMRVTCPQALALWHAEHALFEAQTRSGQRVHLPSAVAERWRDDQGMFVELLGGSSSRNSELRGEMAYESQLMRHCLGQFADRRNLQGGYGEHYASQCEAGKLRIFSYRTGQNHPHITISALVNESGLLAIDQVKGKQNRPPVDRYRDAVLDFLNSLPTAEGACADAAALGLVRVRAGWRKVGDVVDEADQLLVTKNHSYMLPQLPSPSPLVQWLAAAKDPSGLSGMALAPTVAYAVAQATSHTPGVTAS
ncbi:hypothetical protein ACIGHN_27045 [Acidovorax sp. NPDC077693]|uniref:hypothetical protein n=1 Tax=unclassified Acidovorax TaxID=2684926 RepID=UPI0037C5B5E1